MRIDGLVVCEGSGGSPTSSPRRAADECGWDAQHVGIARDGANPKFIAFTRGEDGRIGGLRCDRLVRMVRTAADA